MFNSKLTKDEKSWILYDVANSAYVMLVATILPILSKEKAISQGFTENEALSAWSYIVAISTLVFIFLGPVLGAFADNKGNKKKLFGFFLVMGVLSSVAMGFAPLWAAFLGVFLISKIGYNGSLVFYDSMLTDITTNERMDEISARGYAYGYIGSCIPFICCVAVVLLSQNGALPFDLNGACAISLIITSLWWFFLSFPLFRRYKQRYFVEVSGYGVRETFARLGNTIKNIKKNRHIFLFLLAFFFYIDGVYTIIELATPYGLSVGIDTSHLLLALLLTQFVAFPFSILAAKLAKKFSTKNLLEFYVIFYVGICIFAFQLDKNWEFWLLAVLVGTVQGGVSSMSRSYFAKIIPKEHSNEFFGFFDIFSKGASVLGTFLMGLVTQLTDKPNLGIIPIAVFLLIGFVILRTLPKEERASVGKR